MAGGGGAHPTCGACSDRGEGGDTRRASLRIHTLDVLKERRHTHWPQHEVVAVSCRDNNQVPLQSLSLPSRSAAVSLTEPDSFAEVGRGAAPCATKGQGGGG